MKINYCSLIKVILLIGSSGFYFSCNEPFPELPAETQTGAGTFGCLVNNELVFVVPNYNWTGLSTGASYDPNIDQLRISARCQFGQEFEFLINDPQKKWGTTSIDTIRYLAPNATEWMEAIQTGSMNITRIDNQSSNNSVVSGTFFFDLNAVGKAPIHVTQGRFDLTFYSY